MGTGEKVKCPNKAVDTIQPKIWRPGHWCVKEKYQTSPKYKWSTTVLSAYNNKICSTGLKVVKRQRYSTAGLSTWTALFSTYPMFSCNYPGSVISYRWNIYVLFKETLIWGKTDRRQESAYYLSYSELAHQIKYKQSKLFTRLLWGSERQNTADGLSNHLWHIWCHFNNGLVLNEKEIWDEEKETRFYI